MAVPPCPFDEEMSPSSSIRTVIPETLESRETSEGRLIEKLRKLKVKVLKEIENKRKRELTLILKKGKVV